MKIEIKENCPLNKFKPCKKIDCAWYVQVKGLHPQTGEQTDHFSCAISWFPVLMIENSQQQRQTGAAVESFRNEMVKANATSQDLLLMASNIKRLKNE